MASASSRLVRPQAKPKKNWTMIIASGLAVALGAVGAGWMVKKLAER